MGLADAKEEGLHVLNGVNLEVEADEEEAVAGARKGRFATAALYALAGCITLLLLLETGLCLGVHEGRQQLGKGLKRKPRELLKDVVLVRKLLVAQPGLPPPYIRFCPMLPHPT